ncbi:MAG TPA: plastocyanin/azurin family copper-binding protein [Balneolaceae bacterium]
MRHLTFLLPLFLFLSACGGGNNPNEPAQSEPTQTETAQKAVAEDDIRTIDIIGINKMKFVVEENGERIGTGETVELTNGETFLLLENIKASPGEKIRIRLTTITKLPAGAMVHNWVLLMQGADADAFATAAAMARASDYIPADLADQIIAHTDLAAGGETVEVTFTVPDQTGSYDYLCSFPGHFAAGMSGKLIVE